jgi:hypothetical protein
MMKKCCRVKVVLLIISLFLAADAFGFAEKKVGKITGDVDFNLKQQKIAAKLKFDYVAAGEPESEIKLYLNEKFNVRRVECKNCRAFNFDAAAKPLATLTIALTKTLQSGERLSLHIEYDGDFSEMFHKEHDFLELGLDWFWYPVHRNIGQFDFLYRLNIKSDAPDFQLAGNGRTARKGGDWLVESRVADNDIALVLGKNLNFRRYAQDGYDLQVVSKNVSDETGKILLANIRETLDFYNAAFGAGDRQRAVTAVIRPFPEIAGQGGYFRKGYFILPKIDDAAALFFPVAHELAHYWWLNADQQNAWLNESFAEYSAMLAVRKIKGAAAFEEILAKKQKNSANLPPVYGFDRTQNRRQTPLVLYVKGALKLYDLEKDLGEERFLAFLRKVAEAKIGETDKLVDALAQFSTPELADKFLANLKL